MEQLAPPVVAVVVSHDPGPWFEEGLAALASQDYPNFSILVLDAASSTDPTTRVASVVPSAYVRRLPQNKGFGPTVNEVMEIVEGASHLVLCHDDVAPEPDAVRQMVEEAFRSNAGLVAPKLVEWEDPAQLVQIGMGADKMGAPAERVAPGELDQAQHDSVRDVFVAPGGATLVRADLFETLGGFDSSMFLFGEDLDLSWRAQLAGARVVVAPSARVRHRQAARNGQREIDSPRSWHSNGAERAPKEGADGPVEAPEADTPVAAPAEDGDPGVARHLHRSTPATIALFLQRRHELRAVLKNYSALHLCRVLPQMVVLTMVELAYSLARGRTKHGRAILSAWRWNLAEMKELRAARRQVRSSRRLSDRDVRRLQVRGSARVSAFLRHQAWVSTHRQAGAQGESLVRGRLRPGMALWAVIALVLAYGSRHLLSGPLPVTGQLAPLPGVGSLFHQFASGWRTTGVGNAAPAPLAFGLMGLAGSLLLGGVGLLQKVLFLGGLPLGAVGIYRLCRPLSSRCRLVATVVYVALPLPYNALADGRLQPLLLYGAFPWILSRLLVCMGVEPFSKSHEVRWGATGAPWRGLARQALSLGIVVTLVFAFVPATLLIVLLTVAALVLGSLVAGRTRGLPSVAVVGVGSVIVALVLSFPGSLDLIGHGADPAAVLGLAPSPSHALGFGAVIRFQTGLLGGAPLGWVFALAAALPLVMARGWRFSFATRCWSLAAVFWLIAWAGARGWLGSSFPFPDVLLVPAAAGVALSSALGIAAFERDLPRYRFGWRQALSTVIGAAVVIGGIPVLAFCLGGRWNLPSQGFDQALSWMPGNQQQGGFRVLWLGDPAVLPLSGWRLSPGLAYATSQDGLPTATDLWPSADPGSSTLMADAVQAAQNGRTALLGRLLSQFGIRYIVVPTQSAPASPDVPYLPSFPPPGDLSASLSNQVDLRQLNAGGGLMVFQNTDWAPQRAQVGGRAAAIAAGSSAETAALFAPLAQSRPVLSGGPSSLDFTGRVSAGHVLISTAFSSRWVLSTDGRAMAAKRAFGWSNLFTVPRSGNATLSYQGPLAQIFGIMLEAALWVAAIWVLVRTRRGVRRRMHTTAPVEPVREREAVAAGGF